MKDYQTISKQRRIRDYGVVIGTLPPGPMNSITDVPGVLVGHCTLSKAQIQTGVTAILPHRGNVFREKVVAACHVINGFGKTAGTIQIEELGTIETPIVLTNTLSVGIAYDAVVKYTLEQNPDIGLTTGTLNPIVCECNDSFLNDIRGGHVKQEHVFQAIENADLIFDQGAFGAGTGMSCYGLKGGIGSASRQICFDQKDYTLGALVLANFGLIEDLLIDGKKAGRIIKQLETERTYQKEQGSIIIVLATDVPTTERQLKRLARRATAGIARTGSFIANGSGDVVISFTTANRVHHDESRGIVPLQAINENQINTLFRAVVESVEEAILNALTAADSIQGRDQHVRHSLANYINEVISK